MLRSFGLLAVLAAGVALIAIPVSPISASVITESDIRLIDGTEVASGNGTADLILFGFAGGGGVNSNAATGFNADDANTSMPTGNTSQAAGAYITCMGDLRDFYRTNFPDGRGGSTIREIGLFVDLSEHAKAGGITLDLLRIVIDYDLFAGQDPRNDPYQFDIGSATQNSTGSSFAGGTELAATQQALSLPLTMQGAGWADAMIKTGIDPFDTSLSDTTRILFYWQSSDHEGGGDKVFISGTVAPSEVPEPASMSLVAAGILGLLVRRRKAA